MTRTRLACLASLLLLGACPGGGAGSYSTTLIAGNDTTNACKPLAPLKLGVSVPTPGSFVGVTSEQNVVYQQDVGCKKNAAELLAQVEKLVGAPAKRTDRTDDKGDMTYFMWENNTTSLGLMVQHQGAQWMVTLGFSPVKRKV